MDIPAAHNIARMARRYGFKAETSASVVIWFPKGPKIFRSARAARWALMDPPRRVTLDTASKAPRRA